MVASIDITFKMYTGTPPNKDPDTYSRKQRDYHLLLWNKPLPSGKRLKLTGSKNPPYSLTHKSELGEFCLSSDSILHTYTRWTRESMSRIIRAIPKSENERKARCIYTWRDTRNFSSFLKVSKGTIHFFYLMTLFTKVQARYGFGCHFLILTRQPHCLLIWMNIWNMGKRHHQSCKRNILIEFGGNLWDGSMKLNVMGAAIAYPSRKASV